MDTCFIIFVLQIQPLALPVNVKLTVRIGVSNIQMSSPPLSEKKSQDSVVAAVIEKFQQRSDIGIKKYGTTLDREDLGLQDWIQHVQEELMDAILYLEKLKKITADKQNESATL